MKYVTYYVVCILYIFIKEDECELDEWTKADLMSLIKIQWQVNNPESADHLNIFYSSPRV